MYDDDDKETQVNQISLNLCLIHDPDGLVVLHVSDRTHRFQLCDTV